ncbi:MAG TPA: hypothetical protein VKS01_12250 [Bryobacteraceae bacterium]|nr:hypothetical protein [Bryobacteraceae bacterium]
MNIHEAKTHLSKYVKKAQKGQRIVLCIRNVPVAELRSLPKESDRKAGYGAAKGQVVIHPEFFDPMPDEFLAYFDGRK